MSTSRRSWFGIVRQRFFRSTAHETTIVIHINNTTTSFRQEDAITRQDSSEKNITSLPSSTRKDQLLSQQHIAAIKIQACFRAHLARQAFRAIKSLVKLQAVVRGACVRRQARIALHCMHSLARLQVTVRARQLLRQVHSSRTES